LDVRANPRGGVDKDAGVGNHRSGQNCVVAVDSFGEEVDSLEAMRTLTITLTTLGVSIGMLCFQCEEKKKDSLDELMSAQKAFEASASASKQLAADKSAKEQEQMMQQVSEHRAALLKTAQEMAETEGLLMDHDPKVTPGCLSRFYEPTTDGMKRSATIEDAQKKKGDGGSRRVKAKVEIEEFAGTTATVRSTEMNRTRGEYGCIETVQKWKEIDGPKWVYDTLVSGGRVDCPDPKAP
jgi:hypothetical protein